MGNTFKMIVTTKPLAQDTLQIDHKKGAIKLTARMLQYRDKDTRQVILYVPSLEVSGYGSTYKKAHSMINYSLNEYLDYLFTLPIKKLEKELR